MIDRTDLSATIFKASDLLASVENGSLALPDFQRRFEWNVTDVRSFLSTVLANLPAGSLLIADNAGIRVQLRPLEGAPELTLRHTASVNVLLDGQQRLTALWQATRDVGPDRYFVDFRALIDGADLLQDNVVVSAPAYRVEKYLDKASRDGLILVPVSALMTRSHFFTWLQSPERERWSDAFGDEILGDVFADQIHPVAGYGIPVTRLTGDLNLSTVAQIFERTNRGGQKLDAFDLLVARLQSVGWSLRAAWDDATRSRPEIGRVFGDSGFSTISAISLFLQGDVRQSAVLSLDPNQISIHWDAAVAATSEASLLLLSQGVRKPELLPYDAIGTVVVAARMAETPLERLADYYWTASSGLRYEVASNTKAVADFRALADGRPAEFESDWSLTPEAIEMNTRRSSRALWATVVSLLLAEEPLDLATGRLLTSPDPADEENWELVPLIKGGGYAETEKDVPARLRAAGQLIAIPGRSGQLQKLGLVELVRRRTQSPDLEILGPGIEVCLRSQLMPPASVVIGGLLSPRDLIHDRAVALFERLRARVKIVT